MKHLIPFSTIVAGLLLSPLPSSAHQATSNLYVRHGATGTSCSKRDPCGSVQTAVDRAKEGDTVRIGKGTFHENVFVETAGITLRGVSRKRTRLISAGGRDGAVGNAGNPLDAVIEVRAMGVTVRNMSLSHPSGTATKRDAAIFVWVGSDNFTVKNCNIARNRDARTDEPTVPGSRGVFILLSPGSLIEGNHFRGNYQDHVHLPTGGTLVQRNRMRGASRAGVSVMDPDQFPDFPSMDNLIRNNVIRDSLDDGIHIQGDRNTIVGNRVINNGGYGVYLCGEGDDDCYPPGRNAVSEGNEVHGNVLRRNVQGTIGDFGDSNSTNN